MKFSLFSVGMMIVGGLLGTALVSVDAFGVEHPDELILEVHATSVHPGSDSVDAISDDGMIEGVALGLGYDLSGLVLPGLRGFVLFDAIGQSTERFNGAAQLDWERQVVMVAADYGYDLLGFLRPSVRVGAGYATQKLGVHTSGAGGSRFVDRTHDLAATGAVGLELFVPFGDDPEGRLFFNRVTLGLGGHFGYMYQTAAEFDELEADGDSWQREALNFGALDMNGLYWNLGLTVRVRI